MGDEAAGLLAGFLLGIGVGLWVAMNASPSVYPKDVKYAEKVCATNEGVEVLSKEVGDDELEVTCNNGAYFYKKRAEELESE